MSNTSQRKENLLAVTTDRERLDVLLSELKDMKEKLPEDEKAYYDEEKDRRTIEQYYSGIDFEKQQGAEIIESLNVLLKDSHTNTVRYDPTEYVYPWVDLRPDGSLVSIYSGQKRQAEEVIKEDFTTALRRKEEIEKVADYAAPEEMKTQLLQIASNFKYNCEHVVPQSWFNEREPMRGDLHHLFTCDPVCNSSRNNFHYHDFLKYKPEKINPQKIRSGCGKAEDGLFEPEYAKGIVSRAMLYFLLRYPGEIEQSYMEEIDVELLLEWHQVFPAAIYEKHRNQAIYEIQGNRNPLIDFPEHASKMLLT